VADMADMSGSDSNVWTGKRELCLDVGGDPVTCLGHGCKNEDGFRDKFGGQHFFCQQCSKLAAEKSTNPGGKANNMMVACKCTAGHTSATNPTTLKKPADQFCKKCKDPGERSAKERQKRAASSHHQPSVESVDTRPTRKAKLKVAPPSASNPTTLEESQTKIAALEKVAKERDVAVAKLIKERETPSEEIEDARQKNIALIKKLEAAVEANTQQLKELVESHRKEQSALHEQVRACETVFGVNPEAIMKHKDEHGSDFKAAVELHTPSLSALTDSMRQPKPFISHFELAQTAKVRLPCD